MLSQTSIVPKYFILSIAVVLFLFLFLLSRYYIAAHETLWLDEAWSLTIVTGHVTSPDTKRYKPEAGDYLDLSKPMPASFFKQYLAFKPGGVNIKDIIRACLLSDYNTPVYYLILAGWLSKFGISDLSLRAPAIIFSFMTLPFIWLIASRLSGRKVAVISCLFFAFAPMGLYYSTEGRLYAFLVFLSSICTWLTLVLPSTKKQLLSLIAMMAWTITSGVALLTSYTFLPTFISTTIWLFYQHKLFPRMYLVSMFVCAVLMSLSWYVHIPEIFTIHNAAAVDHAGKLPWWLMASFPFSHLINVAVAKGDDVPILNEVPGIIVAMILLPLVPLVLPITRNRFLNSAAAKFFLIGITYAGALNLVVLKSLESEEVKPDFSLLLILLCSLAILGLIWKYSRNASFSQATFISHELRLLYLIVIINIFSPLFFDLIANLHYSNCHRYVLAAFPAAIALAATALSKATTKVQALTLIILFCSCIPVYIEYACSNYRNPGAKYQELAQCLANADSNDLILFEYYTYAPTALVAARYMPDNKEMVAWSSFIERKNPAKDLSSLLRNKRGVYFVRMGPDEFRKLVCEKWLANNARLELKYSFSKGYYCKYYVPIKGKTFR